MASTRHKRLQTILGHLVLQQGRSGFHGDALASSGVERIVSPTQVASTMRSSRRVAIIGAGMGGSHAAFWLNHLAQRSSESIIIDVYERKQRAGGRAFAEKVLNSTTEIEIGASMMIKQNKYMLEAARNLGLQVHFHAARPGEPSNMAIWDGHSVRFLESGWKAVTMAKLLSRYGPLSFYRLLSAASSFIKKFDGFYELQENEEAFETAQEFWDAVGMLGDATTSGSVALENALSGRGKLLDELVGGLMRNNYNMVPSEASALTCFTSIAPFAAGGSAAAWSVVGGNHQIAEGLLLRANVNLNLKSMVQQIVQKDEQFEVTFSEALTGCGSSSASGAGLSESSRPLKTALYDAVIIATPASFDGGKTLQFELDAGIDNMHNGIHQLVHVTFVAGHLSATHFGIEPTLLSNLRDIFVPESTSTPYNSIGRVGMQSDGTPIWKFFSTRELHDEDLAPLFETRVGSASRYQWRAYPRMPTALPPLKLMQGLFFASAVEYGTSAMEVMAVGGRNAALLTARHLGLIGPIAKL